MTAAAPAVTAGVLLGFGRARGDPETCALTVLLAVSEPSARLRASGALDTAGHRAVPAATWAEAVARLSRTPVDAVLLDPGLSGARGLEAGRALRRWAPPLGVLPLLALSASRTPGLEQTCREAGFDGLLQHPLQPGPLNAALRRVVACRTPPAALDAALRAALRARLGAAELARRDQTALSGAVQELSVLRDAPGLPQVAAAAARVAAACAAVGAVAAAQAAESLAAAPDRRPVLLAPLLGALTAARTALRRDSSAGIQHWCQDRSVP